jgi:hypothetical protein
MADSEIPSATFDTILTLDFGSQYVSHTLKKNIIEHQTDFFADAFDYSTLARDQLL